MDQAVIDQIVSNVLAQLQPLPARPVIDSPKAPVTPVVQELTAAVITADLLTESVRGGQSLRIGRKSILTPSARDWLNTKKIAWSRGESAPAAQESEARNGGRWQLIVQTVTPSVRALQDALRQQPEGWKMELVGQPLEAATLGGNLISTAERDGVVVISEYAEIIACRTNRNARVRAAVISDRNQLELTRRHLGVNLVCINPNGRTFIELRNLLRDCAATKPAEPVGWSG